MLTLLDDVVAGDVVVFDADGTLWRGDVGEGVFARARHLVDDATLDGPVRTFLQKYGHPTQDVWHSLLDVALADGLCDGTADVSDAFLRELYGVEAWIFAGRTPREVRAFADEIFDEICAPRPFVPELLATLRGRGARCLVCSGSLKSVVEAGAERLGFRHDEVFGTAPHMRNGRYLASADVLFGDEKAKKLRSLGHHELALAFGDSPSGNDRAMMEMARTPVAVSPSGKHRAYAKERGWRILDHHSP